MIARFEEDGEVLVVANFEDDSKECPADEFMVLPGAVPIRHAATVTDQTGTWWQTGWFPEKPGTLVGVAWQTRAPEGARYKTWDGATTAPDIVIIRRIEPGE